jgi:fimbrial isopeptide formation D2 family protein/LPXTG-motif cell wall-anchored protein
MNDILKTYMERFRENRHTLRRYTAFVLALAMITTLFVNWQLHGVGISMTAQYQCGEEEHAHTADCYTKVLTCGYEEGELENADEVAAAAATSQPTVEAEPAPLALEPQIEFVPHEHTEDCYTEVQTLTCMEEEHVHGDDCFDPEDGTLICEKFEHTHDESCYTTEYELTCGLEEGELVEQVVEPTQSAELAAMAVAEPVALEPTVDTVEPIYHHHTDACYEEVLTCPLPEHHHTVACLSDTSADVETPEEWQAANDKAVMTGNWDEDLLSVAKTQLGYEQSEKNFEIDPADGVTLRYYSRYGQSYGNPYGEWDVMFLSYCLKYAGIPQSAIPQEASVLSLRSSMSDMDWLLDGEDGSAANVGDIVIYNKYVTRTVAVDSSADGAADDLDDQFSMDAEGENGAELEESGAAALDTAPAAEDAPAADSVITPDLPGTANPEQPAAKPVDSTGTSASGADTLIPSVVSPAAEPQTTTVTDAQPVETVGIVSEADENTLTVISGDVDGKVAEVTLSNAEVLAVVDVAAAQYADEMLSSAVDGALKAPDMLTLAGEPMTASTTATLNDNWITGTTITLNGNTYTVKGTPTTDAPTLPEDVSVTVNDNVSLHYGFDIPDGSAKGVSTLTYKLPSHLIPLKNTASGYLTNGQNETIGTITVDTNGLATLTFNKPLSGQTSGTFYVDCRVSETSTSTENKIRFPGTNHTVEIKKQTDVKVKKEIVKNASGSEYTLQSDGTYKVHYKVTVSTKNGSGETIDLVDKITEINNISDVKYQDVKLYKNGSTDPYNDCKVTPFEEYGRPAIKITTKNNGELPALNAGQYYTLEYDLVFKKTKQDWGNIKNTAFANGESNGKEISFQNELQKYGSYDPKTREITWTIEIYPNGNTLAGLELNDTLPTGTEMTGKFIIKDKDGKKLVNKTDFEIGKNKFTYTFPTDSPFNDPNANSKYTVTYTTTAPADFATNPTVSNTATIKLNGGKKWEGTGSAGYNKGSEVVSKTTKSGNNESTLTTSDLDTTTGLFTLPWKLEVQLPDNEGANKVEIQDTIKKPENGDHYAVKSELETAIQKNLLVFVGENSYGYNDLLTAGLKLTIHYYAEEDCKDKDEYISPNDNDKVRSFKLTFEKTDTFDLDKVVISEYSTKASYDKTALKPGDKIKFQNKCKGKTATYYFTVPADNSMGLVKTSSNTAGGTNSEGSYSANDVTVEKGNGYTDFNGVKHEGTYIYYQLELTPGDLTKWTATTVTDTLQDGLTYVKDSAYVVVRRGAEDMYTTGNTWRQYMSDAQWYKNGDEQPQIQGNLSTADFFSVQQNGQKLTFGLTGNFKYLKYPDPQLVDRILIRFAAQVDDSIWDPTQQVQTVYFSNSAKWGEYSSTTKTEVKHESQIISKKGQYDNSTGYVRYSVVINPDKLKLGTDKMIELVDDMHPDGNESNTAALVRSTVKLYSYDPTAPDKKGAEIADGVYTVDYKETQKNQRNHYILTVSVPNGYAYVLEYAYRNTSNTSYQMKNTAELCGKTFEATPTKTYATGAGGTADSAGLHLYKVDSRDARKLLPGATFKLEWFDIDSGTYKDVQTVTTDANGEIDLTFSAATSSKPGEDTTGAVYRPHNYLYKLIEKQAPDGYRTDTDWAHYFIWTSDSTSDAVAYKTAVGSYGESNTGVAQGNVNVYKGSASIDLEVTNESNRLTFVKQWIDKDGKAIAADASSLPDYINLELWCTPTQGDPTSAVKAEDIKLEKAKSWTYNYPIPEAYKDWYFYVKEVATSKNYTVSYIGNDGVQHGTITIINTETDSSGYELPSTGGTGTLPYTAVGGTMMLSALAYSFIHRKRRHEGRADD